MMSESSDDRKKGGKRKKEKRRHRREEREMDEFNKESFKKMKQEIEDLRRKEREREKELDELKNRIESKEKEKDKERPAEKVDYALNFDRDEYLKKGFIESAKWLKDVIATNLTEKMKEENFKSKFEFISIAKKASTHLGMRTCARFNRGEECNLGRWHMTHKESNEPIRPKQLWTRNHFQPVNHNPAQDRDSYQRRNEIRLHVCTLCLDAFGAAFGHSALNCPWILKKNWIENEEDDSF